MEQTTTVESHPAGRLKFIIGGLLIVAAVVYLIVSSTQASAQYFLTVDELIAKGSSIKGPGCAHLWRGDRGYGQV